MGRVASVLRRWWSYMENDGQTGQRQYCRSLRYALEVRSPASNASTFRHRHPRSDQASGVEV